ncbi:hypothetical protein BDR07DRAFT_1396718 [Suillus spraguei]|nr:hypothetical protein BDR07DRAFT_1396718 [Suillus spraguei]
MFYLSPTLSCFISTPSLLASSFFYLAPLASATHPRLPTLPYLHPTLLRFTLFRPSPPQTLSVSGSSSSTLSPIACSTCFSP